MKKILTIALALWSMTMMAEVFPWGEIFYSDQDDVNKTATAYIYIETPDADITLPDSYIGVTRSYSINNFVIWEGRENLRTFTAETAYGLTNVGDYAFQNCINLESATLGANATKSLTIGNHIFAGCPKLKSLTIGENVIAIGEHLLWGQDVNVPVVPLERLYWKAKKCPGFTLNDLRQLNPTCLKYVEVGEKVTNLPTGFCKGMQALDSVVWKATDVEDFTEDELGAGLTPFVDCPNISSFELVGYIHKIPTGLCRDKSLHSITIPSTVSHIGRLAFQFCKVDEVSFSAKVPSSETIENSPLYGIQGVKRMTVGCTNIPAYLCFGMNKLEYLRVACTTVGTNAFFGVATDTLVWNAVDAEDPVSEQDRYFPSATSTKCLILGNNVTHIPAYLCSGMTQLKKVTIGNKVNEVGDLAFLGCTALDTIVWNATSCPDFESPNDNIFFGAKAASSITFGTNILRIPAYLCNNMSMTEVTIPENVEEIGSNAFLNCAALKTINWNAINVMDGIDEAAGPFFGAQNISTFNIGESAQILPSRLCQDMNITEITIPAGVTTVGDLAFFGCKNLTTINWNATQVLDPVGTVSHFFGAINVNKVNLGEGVEYIPARLCQDMKNVTEITIPASVIRCHPLTFAGSGITTVNWNAEGTNYENIGGDLTSAPLYQLKANLTELHIGASVRVIPESMFNQLTVGKITFEEGVTSIGLGAFFGVRAQDKLVLPESVSQIDNRAFVNSMFETVVLPNAVTRIEDETFMNCTKLKYVTLGENVEFIGEDAFYYCDLRKFVCPTTSIPTAQKTSFREVSQHAELYVQENLVEEYKFATGWEDFKIIRPLDEYEALNNLSNNSTIAKSVVDGQLLITREGKTYNAQGAQVK